MVVPFATAIVPGLSVAESATPLQATTNAQRSAATPRCDGATCGGERGKLYEALHSATSGTASEISSRAATRRWGGTVVLRVWSAIAGGHGNSSAATGHCGPPGILSGSVGWGACQLGAGPVPAVTGRDLAVIIVLVAVALGIVIHKLKTTEPPAKSYKRHGRMPDR